MTKRDEADQNQEEEKEFDDVQVVKPSSNILSIINETDSEYIVKTNTVCSSQGAVEEEDDNTDSSGTACDHTLAIGRGSSVVENKNTSSSSSTSLKYTSHVAATDEDSSSDDDGDDEDDTAGAEAADEM